MSFGAPIEFDIKHDRSFIKLHFVLKGKCHYEPENKNGIPITIEDGQFNFFYLPEVQGRFKVNALDMSTVDIECEEAFLKRLFKHEFYRISHDFGQAVKARMPYKLCDESREMNAYLKEKVNEILMYAEQKDINLLHIESVLRGIFVYLFSYPNTDVPYRQPEVLLEEERQIVLEAERILRGHIKKSITVDQLAKTLGTNRHKLNRNFKKMYNLPVFSYLTQIRMEKAKVMLSQKQKNVSEVADMVGYKNPQHFTAAFKKHFGYVPSSLV